MTRTRVGLVLFAAMVLATIFAGPLGRYDPLKPDYTARYAPVSAAHPLGTDGLGRDVFARSLAGGRVSLVVALSATALTMLLGCSLGVLAAGVGGATDTVLARFFDALLAFPGFLLILLAVAVLGGGSAQTVMAMGIAGSPLYFRLARSFARSELRSEYVTAARALGLRDVAVIARHVLPNALASMIVIGSLGVAGAILSEATLSFLGLGIQEPLPSWGTMINRGQQYIFTAWWYSVFPGLVIMLVVLGFNFLGDAVRDALAVEE